MADEDREALYAALDLIEEFATLPVMEGSLGPVKDKLIALNAARRKRLADALSKEKRG